jgi:bifunctional UDP-N-acetylglucosamine pyrophosphorylase/glucosamine-1-phosphate N-acetyltransferase
MAHVIILAGGKGRRMRSDLPKVLHEVGGEPMIRRVFRTAQAICERPTVVVGYRAAVVMSALGEGPTYAFQAEQLGTGHAVACALAASADDGDGSIVVLPGDHPLITPESIRRVTRARERTDAAIALATVRVPDFAQERAQFEDCGRIIRGTDGEVAAIVERKDATEKEARLTEVNVSTYCFRADWLRKEIARLAPATGGREQYLTDLIAEAFRQRAGIIAVPFEDPREGMGVNTPEQLKTAALA